MGKETQTGLVRAIGRWSLIALMINTIIGSGIFGLPSVVAGLLGPASLVAYLIAAAGVGVIMACFAEVASQFRDAGGIYLYARVAFGRFAGIQIGWLAWLVRISSGAANANLFIIYLAEFWPQVKQPLTRALILTLLIGVLAVVNVRGVRTGAQFSNFTAIAKLLPLALFIAVGLFFTRGVKPLDIPSAGANAWLEGLLLLVFAYGGFEAALIPMSEATNPRRDAPFALFTSLAVCTVVYTLIQLVVLGVLPNAAATDRPLAAAARQFMGAAGAAFISVAALLSVYGHLSAQMLHAPRLTFALAESRDFPQPFAAVHRRFRTPHVSIIVFAVAFWALAVAGTFRWNAVLSTVGRLFTYGMVCAALLVLRKKQPKADAFRLPAGTMFAWLGMGFAVALLTRIGRPELLILSATAALAFLNWLWARRAVPTGSV